MSEQVTDGPEEVKQGVLGTFDGLPVHGAGIEIKNVAGGLLDAFVMAPFKWHKGDRVTVVLDVEVLSIDHDPLDDGWRRVHKCKALAGTYDSAARVFIEQHETKLAAKREAEAQGPLDDAIARQAQEELARAELIAFHDEGAHAEERGRLTVNEDIVVLCPECYPDGSDPESEAEVDA